MLGEWAAVNVDNVGLDFGGMRDDGPGQIQPQLQDHAVPHSAARQSRAQHQFGALRQFPATAATPALRGAFLVSETQVSAAHRVGARAIVDDETVRLFYFMCQLLLSFCNPSLLSAIVQVLVLDDSPPPSPAAAANPSVAGAAVDGFDLSADLDQADMNEDYEEAEMIFSQVTRLHFLKATVKF